MLSSGELTAKKHCSINRSMKCKAYLWYHKCKNFECAMKTYSS